MKHSFLRAFSILSAALVVGLAAYAGQTGYPDDLAVREITALPEVRTLEYDGVLLRYRLGQVAVKDRPRLNHDNAISQESDLQLFVSLTDAESGRLLENAQVYFNANTPTGTQVMALGKQAAWGYYAVLDRPRTGRYEFTFTARVDGNFLEDHFCHDFK